MTLFLTCDNVTAPREVKNKKSNVFKINEAVIDLRKKLLHPQRYYIKYKMFSFHVFAAENDANHLSC